MLTQLFFSVPLPQFLAGGCVLFGVLAVGAYQLLTPRYSR